MLFLSAGSISAREFGMFSRIGHVFDEMFEDIHTVHKIPQQKHLALNAKEDEDCLTITISNIENKNIEAEKVDNRLLINTDNTKISLSIDKNIVLVRAYHQEDDAINHKKDGDDASSFTSRSFSKSSISEYIQVDGKLLLEEIMKDSKKYLKFKDKKLVITIPKEKKEKHSLEIEITESIDN